MLITSQGMVNRTHVNEIRVVGRNTQGVRVMGLNEGDKIASIAKIAREDDAGAEIPDVPTAGTGETETTEPDANENPPSEPPATSTEPEA